MKNIGEIFAATADRFAQRIAVTDPKAQMTYKELKSSAVMKGEFFKSLGLPQGTPIAIFAEKSCEVLSVMVAAAYAGLFYVSINPEQTAERINSILTVLEPGLVLYEEEMAEKLEKTEYAGARMTLQDFTRQAQNTCGACEDEDWSIAERETPLYGIFTSGSTGVPKCVLVSHGAVMDFIGHFSRIFQFTEEDVIGNQAPFDFDVSVKDIYTAFFTGAQLVLIPRNYFSQPALLLDYLCDQNVTNLTWAVSALCLITSMNGFSYKVPDKVKRVMFSGEVMPSKHLRKWQEALPDALFVNLYGPSEITCNCTYCVIDHPVDEEEKLPLGEIFPGRKVWLRGEDGKCIGADQIGVNGEICCSGESLALGYYHNEEQTASHFCMLSGDDSEPVRTYRTGDLASFAEDGQMYFAGRADFQIKHMGHRIELEEISRCIDAMAGVDRSCCLYDQKKDRIRAYYTGTANNRELHELVKEKLPLYMVPNKFLQIDEFPLNKNGKIDRKALEGMSAKK